MNIIGCPVVPFVPGLQPVKWETPPKEDLCR